MKKKGIALILSVGFLAILTLIGVSFITNILIERKAAANHGDGMRAIYAADSGISLAIAYMKGIAAADFNASPVNAWGSISGSMTSSGVVSTYAIRISDTASRININDTNPNLRTMLKDLVAVLGSPLVASDGDAIVDSRPAQGYLTKEEIMMHAGLSSEKYNKIKDCITVESYIDEDSEDASPPTATASTYQRKAPVNINTASSEVLQAVLISIIGRQKAQSLADAIITQRDSVPFKSWNGLANAGGFDDFIENAVTSPALTTADKSAIKDNANPNRIKPLTYSTDFCFHPSGVFEMVSTGQVGTDANSDGDLSDSGDSIKAVKEITVLVRIYNIISYTAKEQFRGEDANYNGILDAGEDLNGNGLLDQPVYKRITWLNSCPVVSSDDHGLGYASGYKTIPGAVKLGFWDNFDEDDDNVNKRGYSWSNWQQLNDTMNIGDADSDGDNELYGTGFGWPKFSLFDISKWTFEGNFSIRVNLRPCPQSGAEGQNVTGHLIFCWGTKEKGNLWTQTWGFFYPGRADLTIPGVTVASDGATAGIPFQGKDFCDSKMVLNMGPDLFVGARNDRTYNIGTICYGLTDEIADHYSDYMAEEDHDAFHGVFPDRETLKLVVNGGWPAPNYRTYLAVGPGRHYRWFYNGAGFRGTDIIAPLDNDYHNVPLHSDNDPKYDRYGCKPTINNISNTWQAPQWFLVLYGEKAFPQWDDIRVIPEGGFYQSPVITLPSQVRWGTISWTLTIPSTATPSTETCSVRADTGSGFSSVALNGQIGGLSNHMAYRIDLTSSDSDYSETPVIEDVIFTYIPETRILYWRQT